MKRFSMRKSRWWILPLILLAGVALYLWEPWTPTRQSVDFGSAGAVIKEAQAAMGQVNNYRYSTNVNAGDEIRAAILNRVVKGQNKQQMVDFTWDIPKMSGTAAMYTEGKRVYIYHPLQDKWVLPAEAPTIGPFVDFFWRQLDLVDPVDNLRKLNPNGSNLSIYNNGQNDPDTIAIQVIPQGEALSEMAKALPPQFAGAELQDVKQVFRISRKDLMVTGYDVTARVSLLLGLKQMDFKAVTKPQDYNKTAITIPKPLQDKIDQSVKAQ